MSERIQKFFNDLVQPLTGHTRRALGHAWVYAIPLAPIVYVAIKYRASNNTNATLDEEDPKNTTNSTKSIFRLDDDTSATFVLPDGRKLGYAQYGHLQSQTEIETKRKTESETEGKRPRQEKTVIYCHGLPGSRVEAASWEAIAAELGVRIIAVDRPGYGWSTPHPGRTILDHPKDIELLAKHLELEEYGVMVNKESHGE